MKMQAIPMLPVKHLPSALEFYEKLGFDVEDRRDEWGWASLSYGDCRLMLDQSIMAAAAGPRNSVVYLYPESISEFHDAVRENGLEIPDLETTFYGMTEFRVTDPDGNNLWVGQRTGS